MDATKEITPVCNNYWTSASMLDILTSYEMQFFLQFRTTN